MIDPDSLNPFDTLERLTRVVRELATAQLAEWQARDDMYIAGVDQGFNHSQSERFAQIEAREFVAARRRLEAEVEVRRLEHDMAVVLFTRGDPPTT